MIGLSLYIEINAWRRSGRYYKPWKPAVPVITVSTKKQVAELSESSCFSQRAVYADMFETKHTMNKLEHNTSDHKVIRTRLYSRLLQVNGPFYLSALYPKLLTLADHCLLKELESGRVLEGGVSLLSAQTARNMASKLMSFMFFGEALSGDNQFSKALLRYSQDIVKCMAAFQVTPSFLSPIVHSLLTNSGEAMHHIQAQLLKRMSTDPSTWDEPEDTKFMTIIYNMVDLTGSSDYWNPELLSQSLLGIWFAASHQPWMNLHFVILELCVRQEWQTRLRQELIQHSPLNYDILEQLPLLDSFIKETVRLNPLDTLAIRRKALEPYTFSDGSVSVPAGATVCVSAHDLMHDPQIYVEPDAFEPSRFLSHNLQNLQRRFTEVSETFPTWGYGSLACPGRFHASLVMKMVVAQLLLKYEITLEDSRARTRWSWETFTMPYESTRIVLKRC
ncbi:cytochrome P450 [Xylariaceae sp. FL0662B]|nr:cytochrome P450 [Xylariaceae sp. FL0662B]